MPEIGATLREARMRARIDISEIEAETKIRAKYLRALENEEWDLLPGPTYVRTFLRTYAEALGLDARLLVEEYKLRHEHPSEHELRPIGRVGGPVSRPASSRSRSARGARPPGRGPSRQPGDPLVPRWAVVAGVVAALLIALAVLGSTGGDDAEQAAGPNTTATPARTTPSATATQPARTTTTAAQGGSPSRVARLTLVATGPVYVCLKATGERTLVRGDTLAAGERRGPYRASRFLLTLGNNNVRLRLNGRAVQVPASSGPIGLRVTRSGTTPLSATQRPTCT